MWWAVILNKEYFCFITDYFTSIRIIPFVDFVPVFFAGENKCNTSSKLYSGYSDLLSGEPLASHGRGRFYSVHTTPKYGALPYLIFQAEGILEMTFSGRTLSDLPLKQVMWLTPGGKEHLYPLRGRDTESNEHTLLSFPLCSCPSVPAHFPKTFHTSSHLT